MFHLSANMTTLLKISVMNFNHSAYLWNVGQWGEIRCRSMLKYSSCKAGGSIYYKISTAHLQIGAISLQPGGISKEKKYGTHRD
jgi:hypothetical protein